MYAVIETGGKQYKVREGDTVDVELVDGDAGDTVEIGQVLMVAGDDGVTIGTPTVEGATVQASIVDEVKGDKVVVFKYKPKIRYRRKTGHRQKYTRLQIDRIILPGEEEAEAAEVVEVVEEAPAVEASVAEVPEAAEAVAEPEIAEEPEATEDVSAEEVDEEEVTEETETEEDEETQA